MVNCVDCVFKGKQITYRGDISSPFVIVVESPGPIELAKGAPLLGPAGDLFNNLIKNLRHLLPENFLVTSAIKCLPRVKDEKKMTAACNACKPTLYEELKRAPRKLILAFGSHALHALTGDTSLKITKVRGQLFKSDLASVGVLACFSPSFILRGGGNMQQFRRDLELAVNLYADTAIGDTQRAPQHQFIEGSYKCIDTADTYVELLAEISAQPKETFIGYDLETDGFDPRRTEILLPSYLGVGIICAGVSLGKDKTYVVKGSLVDDRLFQTDAMQCWHNGKYDIGWLWEKGFTSARVDHDSMLASYLLNERGGIHDLEQVGHDWLQAKNYKNMLEEYLPSRKHSYANIPYSKLAHYQAIDAQLTQELCILLSDKLYKDVHLKKAYDEVVIPASAFLAKMEQNGLYVDQETVQNNLMQLGGEAVRAEAEFKTIALEIAPHLGEINMRSPKQLQNLLYTYLQLAPEDTSTDADTLASLPKHAVLEPLLKYRKVQKMVSTFVKPLLEKLAPDGRLHSTFKLHGSTTGRLSSNKPNLQNIPRDPRIRRQFAATPGYVIVDCDLSQAELRVLACLSNDVNMIAIFSEGRSIHDEMAIRLFGEGFNKEQKMIAKNVNFGIIYGITEYGLADQINTKAQAQGSSLRVTLAEAREWIDGWYTAFPQAAKFINECRAIPTLLGTLISPFGRKRRFTSCGTEKMYMLQNEAANFPEQSTAHDITLVSGIRTIDTLRQKYNAKIVNEIHDCLLIETPDDMEIILEVAKYVTDTMKQVPREYGLVQVPFESDPDVSYRWGEGKTLNMSIYAERHKYAKMTYAKFKELQNVN